MCTDQHWELARSSKTSQAGYDERPLLSLDDEWQSIHYRLASAIYSRSNIVSVGRCGVKLYVCSLLPILEPSRFKKSDRVNELDLFSDDPSFQDECCCFNRE
jgi:hypothetical protein